MKKFKFNKILIVTVLTIALVLGFTPPIPAHAATSPTLVGSANYSVLGATTVTNTGATTTVGEVGVSAGTAITGFDVPGGPGVAAGNNAIHIHRNDASAIAAQADNLAAFGALDADANSDASCLNPLNLPAGIGNSAPDATDLAGLSLPPGLYCSLGSFLLTGNLNLTGGGGGAAWVFKTGADSALITSPGSSVTVPTPTYACNVWWRVGSSATLGTTTAFLGNILAHISISMDTGATLYGRAMAYTGAVTLAGNTISGCATALVAPNITLNKIVVGGSSAESAWTLTATGPLPLSGPGAASSTDVVGDVTPGTYTLSESAGPANYNSSTWSCTKNSGPMVVGNTIALLDYADTAICTITNTYYAPSSGGGGYRLPVFLPTINIISTPVVVVPVIPIIPKLPKTGFPPEERSTTLPIVLLSGFSLVSIFLYFAQKKQTT